MANKAMSIREARKHKGLSLAEAASQARVHFSTWWKWEISGVPVKRAPEVARVLGISCDQIRPDFFGKGIHALPQKDATQ